MFRALLWYLFPCVLTIMSLLGWLVTLKLSVAKYVMFILQR